VPINYRLLGQSAPAATTLTSLYTCGTAVQTVVSTIAVCNRGASAGTYRISIRPSGDAENNGQYIVFDTSCSSKDSVMLTLGISLSASDVITVFASTSDFTFNAFGVEIE
jgi:hypothetical protein